MGVRIAVAGGTGTVGRMVVAEIDRIGATPVVIARSTGVDLTTGAGLSAALDGVDVVIDVSNVDTLSAKRSEAFFDKATTGLLAAGAAAGVRHHVALSIVGCDVVDLPYYLGKRRQEAVVLAGPMPWTVLRATQFHEFAQQMIDRSPPGVALALRMRCQPIAAAEVAAALVSAAVAEPAARLPDLGGPREERMDVMVRRLVRHQHRRRLAVPVPMAGKVGRQVAGGGLLPAADGTLGVETFDEWLTRNG